MMINSMKYSGFAAATGLVFVGLFLFWPVGNDLDQASRSPAAVPENYESLTACEKRDVLWGLVEKSQYQQLPPLKGFGAIELATLWRQDIQLKGSQVSDFAPKGWKKLIHPHGAVAKVKFVPSAQGFPGVLGGAECALLRLSLTYDPGDSRPVAPGLAFKVLRDGIPSANVSALVSLDGQGRDFRFFAHPMSNVVPASDGFGQKLVHNIFKRVTAYPEELGINHWAAHDEKGREHAIMRKYQQLFFVPSEGLPGGSEPHDVRLDFMKIPEGTVVYKVYLAQEVESFSGYSNQDVELHLNNAVKLGEVILESRFVASEFGDSGMFFRHELK